MTAMNMETEAIIGLAAGFGSIVGSLILCCVIWNCCCSSKSKQKLKKKKPTGPWMEMCNNSTACSSRSSATPISQTKETGQKWEQPVQKPLRAPYKQNNAIQDYAYQGGNAAWNQQPLPSTHAQYNRKSSFDDRTSLESYDGNRNGNIHQRDTFELTCNDPNSPTNNFAIDSNGENLDRVRKNPELFYQRYLY